MKKLKLLLNIGKRDAQRLGLQETLAGKSVSVAADVADEMLRRGWATEPDRDAPAPHAAPTTSATLPPAQPQGPPVGPGPGPSPNPPAPPAPDLDAMTKDELKAHADRLKIDGVTLAMTKDEMIKVIKKAGKP